MSAHKTIIVESIAKKNAHAEVEVRLIDAATRARWWSKLRQEFGSQVPAESGAESGSSRLSLRDAHGQTREFLFCDRHATPFALQTFLRESLATLWATKSSTDALVDVTQLGGGGARAKPVLEALLTLAELASWQAPQYGRRAAAKSAPPSTLRLRVASPLKPRELAELATRARVLGDAMNLVRTLADTPGNLLRPAEFRARAAAHAKAHGFDFEFWNTARLRKENAGAFLAVVAADPDTTSGLAVLHRKGRGRGPRRHVALVGKGVCFDTGGYNLKTGLYMQNMHRDMTGAAVALATAGAVAELHPEIELTVYLALAENFISPTAYKANDVVVAANGLAIEVMDTDAEGRMVLADALHFASRGKPSLVVDFATLTGAAKRALDSRRAAVFANDARALRQAVATGDRVGERLWAFPLGEDYAEGLKSPVADLRQCPATNPNSDHIYAATFLSEFVTKGVPWVHVDLSAATNAGGLGLVPTDTTAFGVRWAEAFIAE